MAETQALPRTVGFWGTALFPVNGMIGAGIFALPAIMVAAVGNFAPWMMLFGALLILPLALVFSILSTRFDSHGGPVLYAHAAFGSFAGFQAGWTRYASGVVAVAASTLSRLVMYLLTALALPVLQRRDAQQAPWWHLPIAVLAAASSIWVASHANAEAFQMLGLILIGGTGLFFIAARGKSAVRAATV